jgi:hypothetical protein
MTHISDPMTVAQFVTVSRAELAIEKLTDALAHYRAQVEHYRNSGTGWSCDEDSANYYEGRAATAEYALNLLDGYKADR